jgi:cytochrome c oxidase assembly protein subunit 15
VTRVAPVGAQRRPPAGSPTLSPVTTSSTAPVAPAPPSGGRDGRAPRWARRIYLANLVAQMAIVVTGAIVRLTSSGLGCPTWPRCTGDSITPVSDQVEQWHKYVEFGNRTLTGVLIVLALAAAVAAVVDGLQRTDAGLPARPALTWLAMVPLIGTVAQIPLGGITVLTGLNPIAVGSHLLLSLAIVGLVTVLVTRAGEYGDQPVVTVVRREVRLGVVALTWLMALVLVVGMLVTASGPHAGDERTRRLGLDPQTIAWLHADVVVLCIGLLAGLLIAMRATQAPERTSRAATHLLIAFLAQGLVGYVQFFTAEPWALVAVHVLIATVIWWATVRLLLTTRTRGAAPA